MKNRTKYKSLDRLAADHRVKEIWSEEGTADGLWLGLAQGYNLDGCCQVHEYNVKDLVAAMRRVKEGDTY